MKIDLMKELRPTMNLVNNLNWKNEEVAAQFFAQTYYYVLHSVKLLACCIGKFDIDDVCHEERFLEHIKEESNHELMALSDLKRLGKDILDYPEYSETKNFWQTQYYYVENRDPLSIMGYIVFLEKLATISGPIAIKELGEAGIKSTFLKVHSEEDVDHVDKALELIERLPVERRDLVVENMKHSIENYNSILEKMQEAA